MSAVLSVAVHCARGGHVDEERGAVGTANPVRRQAPTAHVAEAAEVEEDHVPALTTLTVWGVVQAATRTTWLLDIVGMDG